MKDASYRDRERTRIAKLARDYKARGYQVYAELAGYESPDNIVGVKPDLVAKKGDETIIIEVKTRDTTKSGKDKIEKLARYAKSIPGARFDLVMTNPRPAPERFKRWRSAIADELIRAHSYYHIWKQLWPSEESVPDLNQYRVFFHYTRAAHLQLFFMSIAKITQYGRNSITFWRLFNEIEEFPDLTPRLSGLEMNNLRERLESHRNLLARIHTYCNKKVINVDLRDEWPDEHVWQDKAVTIKEAETLLQDLESIFNKISSAHDGRAWSFKPVGLGDTTTLLKALSDHRTNVRSRSMREWGTS